MHNKQKQLTSNHHHNDHGTENATIHDTSTILNMR